MISSRTKVALAAAKARGVKLGSPNGAKMQADRAVAFAETLRPIVTGFMTSEGQRASVRRLAVFLNGCGVKTERGGAWAPMTASRLLNRLSIS